MLWRFLAVCSFSLLFTPALLAGPTYTDPEKADADFAYQGEYVGTVKSDNGDVQIGVQVIARGKGKFDAVGYHGGLPGAGWDGKDKKHAKSELKDGTLVITNDDGIEARVKDGMLKITAGGNEIGVLKKTERKSPTLGAKAPDGAVILFDGKNADAFEGGKVEDGQLAQGSTSKQKFGSHTVHIEFRLPYQPEDSGQGRGNSGIYLQGRYEVQMLDSFGLEGEQNECGGIYSVAKPSVNMCLPPLSWQTYDIDYTAGEYDADGKVKKNPRITVKHNGVTIHDNVELPGERNTTAAPVAAGKEPGPVYLQNHGNPVRYRNIWVVEKK
jgi:hypothetical protein